MTQNVKATIIVPLWTSATWWHLIAPNAFHLSEYVIDWVWLPWNDPYLFVKGVSKMGGTSRLQIGKSWPYGLTSRQAVPLQGSQRGRDAFTKVVAPVRAILGKGKIEVPISSGWSNEDINLNDPIEVKLASRLQDSALSHVAALLLRLMLDLGVLL